MKDFKNRQDKVNFLKGVLSGDRKIEELVPSKPVKIEVWKVIQGTDTYTNTKTGESLTGDEYKQRQRSAAKTKSKLFVTCVSTGFPLCSRESDVDLAFDNYKHIPYAQTT